MKAFINRMTKLTAKNSESNDQNMNTDVFQSFNHYFPNMSINSRKIILIAAVFIGICFLLSILLSSHQQAKRIDHLAFNETTQTRAILNQLGDIDSQLASLSSTSEHSQHFKEAISTINADVASIKSAVNSLAKESDIKQVSAQLAAVKEDVDNQMLDLKRVAVSGDASKQFLDPSILPFHVISIDVISEQPFVSVDYANHITPLAVGDSIAGWQMTAADYSAAFVEFKNKHDQYVKVSLQG